MEESIICKFWVVGGCTRENCPYRHSWGGDGFDKLASIHKSIRKVVPNKRSRLVYPVIWNAPPLEWIKINTDGAAHGCPGNASCGGVFRDSTGSILGAFSSYLGAKTPLEAEMQGVIQAIHIAWVQGWHHIWLECDSSLTVSMVKNFKMDVPTTVREEWNETLLKIQAMEVLVSHIYREGNHVADKLANHGLRSREPFTWFSHPPEFVISDALLDASGHVRYRVK